VAERRPPIGPQDAPSELATPAFPRSARRARSLDSPAVGAVLVCASHAVRFRPSTTPLLIYPNRERRSRSSRRADARQICRSRASAFTQQAACARFGNRYAPHATYLPVWALRRFSKPPKDGPRHSSSSHLVLVADMVVDSADPLDTLGHARSLPISELVVQPRHLCRHLGGVVEGGDDRMASFMTLRVEAVPPHNPPVDRVVSSVYLHHTTRLS
jgi:hypothetical protein